MENSLPAPADGRDEAAGTRPATPCARGEVLAVIGYRAVRHPIPIPACGQAEAERDGPLTRASNESPDRDACGPSRDRACCPVAPGSEARGHQPASIRQRRADLARRFTDCLQRPVSRSPGPARTRRSGSRTWRPAKIDRLGSDNEPGVESALVAGRPVDRVLRPRGRGGQRPGHRAAGRQRSRVPGADQGHEPPAAVVRREPRVVADGKRIAFVSATPGPETDDANGDPMVITRYLYKPTASEGLTRFNDNRRLHIFVVDVGTRRVRAAHRPATTTSTRSTGRRGATRLLFVSNREPDPDRVLQLRHLRGEGRPTASIRRLTDDEERRVPPALVARRQADRLSGHDARRSPPPRRRWRTRTSG